MIKAILLAAGQSKRLKSENKLSFGFRKIDIRINDVIFDFLPFQTDIFENEFRKYINVLKTT